MRLRCAGQRKALVFLVSMIFLLGSLATPQAMLPIDEIDIIEVYCNPEIPDVLPASAGEGNLVTSPPQVAVDEELGLCAAKPSGDAQQETLVATVGVSAMVPRVWTMGAYITIRWDLENWGETTASGSLVFLAMEYSGNEFYGSTSYTLRPYREKTYYMNILVPTTTSVGLKKAVTYATQNGQGIIYAVDWGYKYVQIYGACSTLPPPDAVSVASNNPNYYWEGLPNDGFGVPSANGLYHPDHWWLRWYAATAVDTLTSDFIERYDAGISIVNWVHQTMTPGEQQGTPGCEVADTRIMDFDRNGVVDTDPVTGNLLWYGVCDEYATIAISLCRALGIPARAISAPGHMVMEFWAPNPTTWKWVYGDPALLRFNPDAERYQDPSVCCGFDDRLSSADGAPDDGILKWYYDFSYYVAYDGPNEYYGWCFDCNSWPTGAENPWVRVGPSDGYEVFRTIEWQGWMYSSGSYLYCTNLAADAYVWKHGPLHIHTLTAPFYLRDLEQFRVELELVYEMNRMGDVAVMLYDDQKQLVQVFTLYDSWYGTTSRSYLDCYGTTTYESWLAQTWYSSWYGVFTFRVSNAAPYYGVATFNGVQRTYGCSFDADTKIRYIGFQFARAGDYTYHDIAARIHDIDIDYRDVVG